MYFAASTPPNPVETSAYRPPIPGVN
jgi:hypothetical protein